VEAGAFGAVRWSRSVGILQCTLNIDGAVGEVAWQYPSTAEMAGVAHLWQCSGKHSVVQFWGFVASISLLQQLLGWCKSCGHVCSMPYRQPDWQLQMLHLLLRLQELGQHRKPWPVWVLPTACALRQLHAADALFLLCTSVRQCCYIVALIRA
jgi:hypothetical protein